MWIDKTLFIIFVVIFFFIMRGFAKSLEKIKDDTYDIKSIIEEKLDDNDLAND